MRRFFNPSYSYAAAGILGLVCLFGSLAPGQSVQAHAESTTGAKVQGIVRDSDGHPIVGAMVYLQADGEKILTVLSDSSGEYHLSGLRRIVFTLRAEKPGYSAAIQGPYDFGRDESRTIDLALEPARASASQNSSPGAPAFFDEPHFTVAGVTDTTNLGGHGSDAIVRNRDVLAEAAASLKGQPAPGSPPMSVNAAIERSLRSAAERQPADFDANYRLGKLLVDEGKPLDGLVYLERASQLHTGDYDNNYELALARANSGDYERARVDAFALLHSPDSVGRKKAGAHHLMGWVSEKLNDPLEAVRQYQSAAELNPSEPYVFDWGAELLLHHAAEPAVEVFTKGNRLFPASARMLAGLGASLYALGSYDQAALRLCEASDLNPHDPGPYLFVGKMQAVEAAPSEAIQERLERFVKLQPDSALANYYYAVSVVKRRKSPEDSQNVAQVKSLLEKAVQLDPTLGAAHLQLGILYSEQRDFPNAIAAYRRAIAAAPDLEAAHFRLAQAYRQMGEPSKAKEESQLYEQILRAKSADADRQRHQVQQFVYQLQTPVR